MQVSLASLVKDIVRISHSLVHCLAHLILYLFYLIHVVQVRYLSNIENIVDIFNEEFLLDIRVLEGKHYLFVVHTQTLKHRLEIVLPLILTVALSDLYLKDYAFIDKGC